ncbi:MAG: prepilin-type N-terminal cleavage/methylation domain-containing protein [Tepidisphaeraceae bacterium]
MEHRSPAIDRAARGRRGFTLVESLIASVVLAVAVVGVAGTLAASYQQSRDQVAVAEATAFARQMLEEISARPVVVVAPNPTANAGWTSGNTNRATYDDVDDYNGYTDVSTSVKTLAGATQSIGTMGPYTRTVSVAGVVPAGHTTSDLKLVQVTVTRPTGPPVVLAKVFTRAVVAQ